MRNPLLRRLQRSLFHVLDQDGATAGTAFTIAGNGCWLTTCMHVLDLAGKNSDGKFSFMHHDTGTKLNLPLIESLSRPADREDVAFLDLSSSNFDCSLVAAAYELPIGAPIYTFGFPANKNDTGTPGRGSVSGFTSEASSPVLALSSSEITAGFSGAPVIDEKSGLLVGMVTSILEPDESGRGRDTAYLTTAFTLRNLNPKLKISTHPKIDRYADSQKRILGDSSYRIPGLPDLRLIDYIQLPLVKMIPAHPGFLPQSPPIIDANEVVLSVLHRTLPAISLTGDAGSGKSTVLRFLGLQILKYTLPHRPVLPIYINARELAESSGLNLSDRLRSIIARTASLGAQFDLDDDFLTDWATQFSVTFVLMIDACDELTDAIQRRAFFRALKEEVLPYLSGLGHHLITASREVEELAVLADEFRSVRVSPLSAQSNSNIISRMLGKRGEECKQFIERMSNRALIDSPLNLILLISLFHNRSAKRDISLIGIYDGLTDLIRDEWRRLGIERKFGHDVADIAIDALSLIAWHHISERYDEERLQESLTEFFAVQTGKTPLSANRTALKFCDFIAYDGGLFRIEDGRPSWLHQNIRDFMAARALCILGSALPQPRDGEHSRDLNVLVEDFWDDPSLEGFVRFALLMARDKGLVVNLIRELIHRQSSLPFVARALADGVSLPEPILVDFSGALFLQAAKMANSCAQAFMTQRNDPVEAFLMLSWREPFLSMAVKTLQGYVPAEGILDPEKFSAMIAARLAAVCSHEQLAKLKEDHGVQLLP